MKTPTKIFKIVTLIQRDFLCLKMVFLVTNKKSLDRIRAWREKTGDVDEKIF